MGEAIRKRRAAERAAALLGSLGECAEKCYDCGGPGVERTCPACDWSGMDEQKCEFNCCADARVVVNWPDFRNSCTQVLNMLLVEWN